MPFAGPMQVESKDASSCDRERIPLRVAFLTNFIPPYSLPVLQCVTASVESFCVFVNTEMEEDRAWRADWSGLNVVRQKTITRRVIKKSDEGLSMTTFRHFPYDTLLQLRSYRPDVVVSGELGFRTLQAATYRLLNPSSRLVIWVDASEHTERGIGPTQTKIRRLLLRAADTVIVNGSSGSKYVQKLSVPSQRITAVPFVSKTSELSRIALIRSQEACRRLLYVGRLIKRRGLDLFFKEIERWGLAHPTERCQVWIVGDGELRKELEQTRLPVNVEASFFGNVPYSDLAPYFASAGVFVLPTLGDTWGLVVNEAMAAGLPVLGSLYSQAAEELIRDGVNGWTYHPDRPEEFHRALTQMLSTPVSVLNRMREQARSSVQHLTPQHSARQFLRAVRLAVES